MFPDEASAVSWFENIRWPEGERHCLHCGSVRVSEVTNAKPMPYRCKDCRSYFSVRTGSAMESSRLPLRKWVFAIYLEMISLKGVSSMKLHRDLKVTQKTAWSMLHRIREAWADGQAALFAGPVEVDETHIGGKRKNIPKRKRKELSGREPVGKATVIGAKDRASNAMNDTEATTTCFDETAAKDAGLPTIGVTNMASASHSNHEVPLFSGRIITPTVNINIEERMGVNLSGSAMD